MRERDFGGVVHGIVGLSRKRKSTIKEDSEAYERDPISKAPAPHPDEAAFDTMALKRAGRKRMPANPKTPI